MNQIVARFTDGRLVKGRTLDFSPSKNRFHMTLAADPVGTPFPIHSADLKALFYVRSFEGDPSHVDTWVFDSPLPPGDHRIRTSFCDGEVLEGTTTAYREGAAGFFLKPADPESNNLLCYVFVSATREVAVL